MKNFIDIDLSPKDSKALNKLIVMYAKKFQNLDSETLLILREELNYILDERSQLYMDLNEV